MSSKFKTCKTLSTVEDVKTFKDYVSAIYNNLAMVNYPYETDFLSPLPPYPIAVIINFI